MTTRDDGGPAFPHSFEKASGHPMWLESQGMALRDYFAAQALAGMLCNGFIPYIAIPSAGIDNRDYPRAAYRLADLMLAERSKP
jgi:hypothetical protein